jgi:hypothetical protein
VNSVLQMAAVPSGTRLLSLSRVGDGLQCRISPIHWAANTARQTSGEFQMNWESVGTLAASRWRSALPVAAEARSAGWHRNRTTNREANDNGPRRALSLPERKKSPAVD